MTFAHIAANMGSVAKKRTFGLMAAALWLVGACGPANNEAVVFAVGGAPSEVTFWEELLQDFERQSGIRVDLLRQPADTDQRRQGLVIALNARKSDPDVFLMDVAWLGLFVASNWLEPLESRLDAAPFFQRVIRMADRHQGHLMALPVYVDGGVLYYRRDLLERFRLPGPPDTWHELLSQALTVQNAMRQIHPRFYGFVWQGAQYEGLICNFLEFSGSRGGFTAPGDGLRLDAVANRTALTFMRDLIWRYRISPPSTYTEMKEEEVRLYFQTGNALFERNWPYAWSLHQNPSSKVKNKIGVAPLPAPTDGERVATLGGWHIGLSRFSDRKPQAVKLIRFITSYDTQKKIMLQMGWNPGREDLYDDPEVLAHAPHYRELKDVFQNAQPRPLLPYYTQISAIAQRHINSVLADRKSAEQALSAAQGEIDDLQRRYEPK
ncbi:MAG: ABC transporter substrate-binding protein [Desulfobacterales bacterium]|nr:MAG: ABC transporter substrate-binding protein [Desulfobacterales bacterium]